ncbi:reverse transcriptase [Gossypium australe]|uniref:Reverse transcriptase n=1 Tax=Gossypium australe TaxID=47621 RepID=A0A5B6VJW8_9ROSI|nr:reverse transcriptase [Gossypium australe]
MEGCLADNADGKSGGLVMMWREIYKVEIQTYSSNHIDLLIHVENDEPIRFTGFYGNADPNKRQCSWNTLRRGGRKPNALMEDFREIVDEFLMVDFKTDNGWFTWVNNRESTTLVKERLDRFLMSANDVNSFPFLESKMRKQNRSLRKLGRVARRKLWKKIKNVGKELGRWHYKKLNQMRKQIGYLQANINRIADSQGSNYEGNKLKAMRLKLGNLLNKEEKYWAQRSRVNWLKERDRNTQFFHVRATNRKKKNNIARLKDINGYWRENTTDICKAIREYFQLLFKSNLNPNNVLNLDYIERCISGEVNDRLLNGFTDSEIKEAFSQMDPRKAPGINDLSGNFFRENWDVVGEDIIKLCHDILRGDKDVECLNDTIIVLIPKIKELEDMTNFRPISLCRVVYKIVAKVLANRLKETLPLCISQNQNAFVLGTMIHDNILIAHEMVHYLQSTKSSPNKGFVIKLDMSKAYDRVEWTLIEEPKYPVANRQLFSSMLSMCTIDKLDSYLGLPLLVSRKKSLAFTNIINRCTCRVRSWLKHLFSYGGKEVFIKAIIQAFPTYSFSVFLAPKGIIEDLQSQMGRMWWTNNDKARRWARMAWEKCVIQREWEAWVFGTYICSTWLFWADRSGGDGKGRGLSRYTGFNNTCPRCKSREETLVHALKDCPKAREVLVARGLNNRLLEEDYNDCIDWLEDVFRELNNKAAANFLTLLWNSWNDNNMVFKVGSVLSQETMMTHHSSKDCLVISSHELLDIWFLRASRYSSSLPDMARLNFSIYGYPELPVNGSLELPVIDSHELPDYGSYELPVIQLR